MTIPPVEERDSIDMINWRMIAFKECLDVLNRYRFEVNHTFSDIQIKDIRGCIENMRCCIDTIEYHQRKLTELIDSGAV